MLNELPPDYLSQPFTFGGARSEMGGVMRQGKEWRKHKVLCVRVRKSSVASIAIEKPLS